MKRPDDSPCALLLSSIKCSLVLYFSVLVSFRSTLYISIYDQATLKRYKTRFSVSKMIFRILFIHLLEWELCYWYIFWQTATFTAIQQRVAIQRDRRSVTAPAKLIIPFQQSTTPANQVWTMLSYFNFLYMLVNATFPPYSTIPVNHTIVTKIINVFFRFQDRCRCALSHDYITSCCQDDCSRSIFRGVHGSFLCSYDLCR